MDAAKCRNVHTTDSSSSRPINNTVHNTVVFFASPLLACKHIIFLQANNKKGLKGTFLLITLCCAVHTTLVLLISKSKVGQIVRQTFTQASFMLFSIIS